MTRFSNEVLEIFRAILKRVAPDVSSLPPLGRLTKQKNRFGVTLGKKLSCARSSATTLLYVCCYIRPKTKSRIRHFGNSAKMMHWRPNATKRHRKMSRHSSAWKKKKKNHHCAYLWIYPWELSKLCRRPSYKESLMMRRLLFKKEKKKDKKKEVPNIKHFLTNGILTYYFRKTVHISFI